MKVELLDIEDALPVRHLVLWPNEPIEFCRIDDDANGLHFGVKNDQQVICVASVYLSNGVARLRKFATLREYRGKGFGSMVLEHIIEHLTHHEASLLWLDARATAVAFYEKFGFIIEGEAFYKTEILYYKMIKSLVH